jgi:ADP-ribosylglycohydrolase/sugar/nucleoside kinase (ribokinase family)
MTLLVAGNAATHDLLLSSPLRPGASEVAMLDANPGAAGEWMPGGAAMTIALAARAQGVAVRLWHPLPALIESSALVARLTEAGIDLTASPRVEPGSSARCVMVYSGDQRLAWSAPGAAAVPGDLDALFLGVTHLVISPVWGAWAEVLVAAARKRGIPSSLIGEASAAAGHHDWHTVVIDERQNQAAPTLRVKVLVETRGERGSVVIADGERIIVPAESAQVVDTTGAGDTFGGTFIARQLAGASLSNAGLVAAQAGARACEGWGAWAAFAPAPPAASTASVESRIRGALAGTACGDAFGMPNSFLSAPPWRTDMEAGPSNSPYHAGYPAGRITDDTEQALALTDALEDGFTVASAARRLNEWFLSVGGEHSLAVGPSTKRALMAYQAGVPVDEIGRFGVTNGAAMRISPIGVYGALAKLSLEDLARIVTTACYPTHATSPAISGATALAAAISAAIQGARWEAVMQAATEGARVGARFGNWIYAADVAARIEHARILAAGARSKSELVHIISDIVGAGEPTTESVPAAIAIADYAKGDPQLAIEIAGNLRGDTDTIAAMAGAVCGAYAGEEAIPPAWRELVARVNQLDIGNWSARLHRAVAQAIQGLPCNPY